MDMKMHGTTLEIIDGNCFFLTPTGQPVVSMMVLMTQCFGVRDFKSLSQSWLALLFSYFTSAH
jgi:hypothetical protein